jgi:DNA polymerase-3 subunit epsilon|tara:strand:+ start:2331 stop:3008 length:678 start_codon:yes stop_codon:yes gene_type:complete
MLEVILDTETTGLSFNTDKIIEIACIELENQIPTKNKFHVFINPNMDISDGAYQTHGITRDFLKDKPDFKDIAKEFLAFIKQSKLVIHNADFDLAFLNKELQELGLEPLSKERVVDTLFLARQKFPGAQASLDALCKRFKIDTSKREKHSALLDCHLLTEVYIELLDKKEPLLDLQQVKVSLNDLNISQKVNENRKKIIVPISDEEKKLHKKFLETQVPKSFMIN